MNEENNLNENQNVQPLEPIVEPTSAPQQPVEETVVAEVTPQVEEPKKKNGKTIIIVALVLVLLAGGGFAVWKFLLPTLNKENKETTTTTTETTTKKVELLSLNTKEDYLKMVSDNKASIKNAFLISLDGKFLDYDFLLKERCNDDGDKVTLDYNGLKIQYTCTDDTSRWGGDIDHIIWRTDDAIINDTYKTSRRYDTCGEDYYYSNGEYFITVSRGCGLGNSLVKIENKNNKVIYDGLLAATVWDVDLNKEDHMGEAHESLMISKDNVLYFIVPEGHLENDSSTCYVKYIDFNEENPEVKNNGTSFTCYDFERE